MIKIKEVLDLYKIDQVNDFVQRYSGHTLDEKNLCHKDIASQWKFLGNNNSNGSTIGILKKGEKGIIERLTNAIDAIIEKQCEIHGLASPKNSEAVIKRAFPKYYANLKKIYGSSSEVRANALDIDNQVILAINDGPKSNKPTFDILDKGIGVPGHNFDKTFLSMANGNKLSSEKTYLIGAFGQGGSTSLPFTESTIIVSKYESKYYFTIIKSVELKDYKNHCYVYMTIDDEIPQLDASEYVPTDYLKEFFLAESGTLIRMVETDISREYRNNDISKPGMLVDYINTELYNVAVPVKIIENRANYRENRNAQGRNAYGSFMKLNTTKKYLKEAYSGIVEIRHNDLPYLVNYYLILPDNEKDWGSDHMCKSIFEQFNVYCDPILYTVNGQTITTEGYTRIKNNGLTFLKYRLLIVVNLDHLGNEKYKFFTSDRSQIKDTDLTKGFIEKVVKSICEIDKLKEINQIVAEKSISSRIDTELLSEISAEVQDIYSKFLKGGSLVPRRGGNHIPWQKSESEFLDHIGVINISSSKREFYSDETVSFCLETGAAKYINQSATICPYIDGKAFHEYSPNFMNGRIEYKFNDKTIKPGTYDVQFIFFPEGKGSIESNKDEFIVFEEKAPMNAQKDKTHSLNLEIHYLSESEFICDIAKNADARKIDVNLCLEGDELRKEVYGFNASNDEISELKNRIIKPIVLFALFMEEEYDRINVADERNKIIISLIKAALLK